MIKSNTQIFDVLPNIGVVITDEKGIILYCNDSFLRQNGYDRADVIGVTPRILRCPLIPPEFYKDLWDTILNGEVFVGELCNIKKNGEKYWVKLTIAPYAEGEKKCFIGFIVDITKTRFDDLKLRAILESSPDIITVYNLDTLECLEVYSDLALKTYPNLKNYKGKTAYEIFYGKANYKQIIDAFTDMANNPGQTQTLEYEMMVDIQTEEGVISMDRFMEATYRKFNHNKCVVMVRDITEKREVVLYRSIKEDLIAVTNHIKQIQRLENDSV